MRNLPAQPDRRVHRGFSFLEVLFGLALLSSIVAFGITFYGNFRTNTLQQNLTRDVATINSAIRIYEANGGDLSGVSNVDDVLDQLKRTSSNKHMIAGLAGSMIDKRISTLPSVEDGKQRAVWNPATRRLELSSSGPGIQQFILCDEAGKESYGSEHRDVSLELASVEDWIWDYKKSNHASVGVANEVPEISSSTVSPSATASGTLRAPSFSVEGRDYHKDEYDLEVELANPNPTGSSIVRYSISGGSWIDYAGEVIKVAPNSSIDAYAASLHSIWQDSEREFEFYSVASSELDLGMAYSKPSYTYKDLGGKMIGVDGSGHVAPPGILRILNAPAFTGIADGVSSSFMVRAAANGVEYSGPEFLSGQASLPLTVDSFGSGDLVSVQASGYSVTAPAEMVVIEKTISAASTELLQPRLVERPRPDGLFVYGEHYVEIALDTESGEIPDGARIYYTLDGSDPGDVNDEPNAYEFTLYTGPFLVNQPDGQPIKARVYSPNGAKQWFSTSSENQIVWPQLNQVEFTVEVSSTPPFVAGGQNQKK
ncbi:MAG: FN3 associated domain-containing protein [Verrucomicrobiota bacterium]